MKATIALLLVVALVCAQATASAIPQDARDNENTVEFVDGYFQAFGLPKPTDILQCGSDQVASQFMTFMPQILNQACHAQKSTLPELRAVVQEFLQTLPSNFFLCLDGTQSIQELHQKEGYPIDWTVANAYVLTHLSSVQSALCTVESSWTTNQYVQAGVQFGDLVKRILGVAVPEEPAVAFVSQSNDIAPLDAEQQFLNGYFAEFELPHPQTIMRCYSEDSQAKIFEFVPELLEKACEMKVSEISQLTEMIEEFMQQLPDSICECLEGNEELLALSELIGEPDMRRVLAYVLTHFRMIQQDVCQIKEHWAEEEFEQSGRLLAVVTKNVLGLDGFRIDRDDEFLAINSVMLKDDDDNIILAEEALQYFLKGYFEHYGLDEPKTVLACYPAESQQQWFEFIPELLERLCTLTLGDVRELVQMIKEFVETQPQSIGDCMRDNEEYLALREVAGEVDVQILIRYLLAHFADIQDEVCLIEQQWNAEEYECAGAISARLTQEIIEGDEFEEVIPSWLWKPVYGAEDAALAWERLNAAQVRDDVSPLEAEQQFLDAYFAEFDLPEPMTILKCFSDESQQKLFEFIPQLLQKSCEARVSEISEIVDLIQEFSEGMPDSICECLEGNEELMALGEQIGEVDSRRILAYLMTHFRAVQDDLCEIKDSWMQDDFQHAGLLTAALTKRIVGADELVGAWDDIFRRPTGAAVKKTLGKNSEEAYQAFLKGMFEQFDLEEPQTVLECIPDDWKQAMFDFFPELFTRASEISLAEIKEVCQMWRDFMNSLPDSIGECLAANEEVLALAEQIGEVDRACIQQYILLNFEHVQESLRCINDAWVAEDYERAGKEYALLLREVLSIDDEEPLWGAQQLFDADLSAEDNDWIFLIGRSLFD